MNTLGAIQILILGISVLFLCIGTFSNYWIKNDVLTDTHAGLYGTCYLNTCVLSVEQRSLTLIIIGLVFEIHGLMIALYILFKEPSLRTQIKQLSIASLVYLILSLIMILAGWSLYVDNHRKTNEVTKYSFDWSIYLVLVAMLACLTAIIVAIINIFKRRNE